MELGNIKQEDGDQKLMFFVIIVCFLSFHYCVTNTVRPEDVRLNSARLAVEPQCNSWVLSEGSRRDHNTVE